MEIILTVLLVIAIIGCFLAFKYGYSYRRKIAEIKIGSAEEEAQKIVTEAKEKAIKNAEILMVDGNEMEAAVEGAKIANESGTKVLYDAGGLYEGVEKLLPHADILIPSEEFSLGHTGAATAEDAAKILFDKYSPEVVVITQGKKGGIMYDGNEIKAYPATPAEVIDSNGAGDVFHGAFACAVTQGYD